MPARRLASLAVVVLSLAGRPTHAQERFGGTWDLRLAARAEAMRGGVGDTTGPVVHVALWTPGLNTFYLPIARIPELTAEQVARGDAPARFTLRRDAGTFAFEGAFRGGTGRGRFQFAPDTAFAATLAARGAGRPTPADLFSLGRHDVGLELLDALRAEGYAVPTVAQLVSAGLQSVDGAEVREMAALGYRLGTLASLVHLHMIGVSPAYVREVAAAGYGHLEPAALIRLRTTGGRPVVAGGSREPTPTAGRWTIARERGALRLDLFWDDRTNWYRPIDADAFTGLGAPAFALARDAGRFEFTGAVEDGRGGGTFRFTPQRAFVDTLRALGVTGAEALGDHSLKNLAWGGIGAADVRAFAALGLPLDARDLVVAAIRLVTPEYVRALRAAGATGVTTLDVVADLRMAGVTPALVRQARAEGGDLSPQGLLSFRERVGRAARGARR